MPSPLTRNQNVAPYAQSVTKIGYLKNPFAWNTGVFECFQDAHLCLEVMCCWHAQLTAQYNKLYNNAEGPLICSCICLACCDAWFAGIPSVICVAVLRAGVRSRYRLECRGLEGLKECLIFFCGCCCCMQCQNHREMHMRGDYPGGCCTEEDSKYIRPRPQPAMGYPNISTHNGSSSIAAHSGGGVSTHATAGGSYGAPPPLQQYPYTNTDGSPPYANGASVYSHASSTPQPYAPYVPSSTPLYTAQSSYNPREDEEEARVSSVYPQYDENGHPQKPPKRPTRQQQQIVLPQQPFGQGSFNPQQPPHGTSSYQY